LLRSLGFKQRDSTVIWEDNRSTILIAENECSSAGRSKHIDIRYKFVAQTIADNIVRVRYTPTDTNLADILTKALPRATFERIAEEMIADAGPGPPLFNMIVALYKKWSRHWKVENPEPSPDSSYESVSSSRASSRTPQSHPLVSQGHSSTPSPRPRPTLHGAYRHSPHSTSVTPPPRHSPSSAGGHASRAFSRSRTPPRASSAPRTARSHIDAALLSLKTLQL
jgi:hypothetical protein